MKNVLIFWAGPCQIFTQLIDYVAIGLITYNINIAPLVKNSFLVKTKSYKEK